MLITAEFGSSNTATPTYYTILNPDKGVYQARTNAGVSELVAGSGVYGVEVDDEVLAGRTVLWDIDGTAKAASETFGSGGADWTADECTAIRSILGIPASGTTPEDPAAGILDTIRDYVDNLESRLGTPAGASVSADIAAVKEDTASILLDTGTDGVVLAGAEHNNIADAILKRDWTEVVGAAQRSVLNALRPLRNKWFTDGSTLTVTEEDDATPAWTATLSTDAAADPITGSDPT